MIGNYSLLEWVILRILLEFKPEKVFLATSNNKCDDALVSLARNYQLNIYRGDEFNVLSRFQSIIKLVGEEEIFARVCADNPFVSPTLLINKLEYKFKNKLHYCHSLRKLPYYPYIDGLGSEIFDGKSLLHSLNHSLSKDELEHVTKFITKRKSIYKISGLPTAEMYRFPRLSLDIDTAEEYQYIQRLVIESKLDPTSNDSEIIDAANRYKNNFETPHN